MTDEELISVTTGFREGLGITNPRGNCFVVCAPLAGYLSFLGVDAILEWVEVEINRFVDEYEDHCVIRLYDSRILDPPAAQYPNMPSIYLGKLPDNYRFKRITSR